MVDSSACSAVGGMEQHHRQDGAFNRHSCEDTQLQCHWKPSRDTEGPHCVWESVGLQGRQVTPQLQQSLKTWGKIPWTNVSGVHKGKNFREAEKACQEREGWAGRGMKEQEGVGREQKKEENGKTFRRKGRVGRLCKECSQVERWSKKLKWCLKDKALRPLPCLAEPVLKCSAKEVLVNPKDQSEADKMHSH